MPTKIEWVKGSDGRPGETWNPIIAINKETGKRGWFCIHADDSCIRCYAERQNKAAHWLGNGLSYTAPNLDKVRIELEPKVLEKPLQWRRPRNIFVCSMSDLFGDWVRFGTISQVWSVCERAEKHTKQILTKRVDRMVEYLRFPTFRPTPDFWLGFSAGRQRTFDERWAQMKPLAEAGWMTWVSLEPLLESVTLPDDFLRLAKWCVMGGESGPEARAFWLVSARELIAQCREAKLPCFVKQLGSNPVFDRDETKRYLKDYKGGNPAEWPEDLRIQEFPSPRA